MKKKILSILLFHANTGNKSTFFYNIKNKILLKHGKHIGDDYQYLQGQKCYSCNGTGIWHSWCGNHKEWCYKCAGSGMYKDDRLVHLKKIQIGSYVFHQPVNRSTIKDWEQVKNIITIHGYIDHNKSKHCSKARFLLFLIYEKCYLKRWWRETGYGWRVKTFDSAENLINNIVHIIKEKHKSYPIQRLLQKYKPKQSITKFDHEDLPF